MKKVLLIVILSLTVSQFTFAQEIYDTESDTETNIYFHALQKYFDTLEKNIPENNKEYYIEKRHIHLDSFPNKINGFKINWVKELDLENTLESLKTDFITIWINPIKIKKDDFHVVLIPFYANSKYKIYTVRNGVYTFHYGFDSEMKGLKYKKLTKE